MAVSGSRVTSSGETRGSAGQDAESRDEEGFWGGLLEPREGYGLGGASLHLCQEREACLPQAWASPLAIRGLHICGRPYSSSLKTGKTWETQM